jgi:hypothetical protein
MNNIKLISLIFLMIIGFNSCQKKEYSFGELKTPSNLTLSATVKGVDSENPYGDGKGYVFLSVSADDKISYKVTFGNKDSLIMHSDTLTYKYRNPGTNEYTVTVNAIGTGGVTSTISTKIKVYVDFIIPKYILEALTNNSSKTWILDKNTYGQLGMGPVGSFTPDWWNLDPNNAPDMAEKSAAHDDEVTFSTDESGNIFMTVDNKGYTFMNANCITFYGATGSVNGGYPLNTEGTKKLKFMDATSESTPDISTRIQFEVPGNGIIIFGVASTTYEILKISNDLLYLRSVGGVDGYSWFQRLIPKP